MPSGDVVAKDKIFIGFHRNRRTCANHIGARSGIKSVIALRNPL